ncbi:hypothetical protein QQ045_024561 [Rhodiola kirilowii]
MDCYSALYSQAAQGEWLGYWEGGGEYYAFCEWLNVRLPKVTAGWSIKDVVNDADIRRRFVIMLSGVTRGVIHSFSLTDKPDNLMWRDAESGTFSTKACYEKLRKSVPKNKTFRNIWQSWIPSKISTVVWRLFHRALPTDDNIGRLVFSMASKCWCCSFQKIETMEHMFVHSELAIKSWEFLAVGAGLLGRLARGA